VTEYTIIAEGSGLDLDRKKYSFSFIMGFCLILKKSIQKTVRSRSWNQKEKNSFKSAKRSKREFSEP
jgi:hypothetical protein